MTYGQIRLRVSKLAPGIDLEIIDGWITDRHQEILDALPWKRLENEIVIQSMPSYSAGTLTTVQGNVQVTGDVNALWTAPLVNQILRVGSLQEFYVIAIVNPGPPAIITLDRPYEQPSGAGLSYRIDQAVFPMPSDCRVVRSVRPLHDSGRIELATTADLDRMFPQRLTYGMPRYAAPTWDTSTDPPELQLELYPIPSSPAPTGETLSFAVDCLFEGPSLDPTQTSVALLPWMRPSAIIAGCQADAARHLKDYNGSKEHEDRFGVLVRRMAMINALQRGPQAIRLAPELRGRRVGLPGYHSGKHANQDYFSDDDYSA